MAEVRLQRYLSQAGVAARRKAEQLILDGAVAVDGVVVTVLGTKVDPATARVTVHGQSVRPEDHYYVVLNKPKGCISAVSDPHDRRTVMEYIYGLPAKVAPVGRLDYYSEGVLLLTNDGELSAALQSPRTMVNKVYHVKFRGQIDDLHIQAWRDGIRLEDGTRTRPAGVERIRTKSSHDWLEITLHEGKSRQIHRMAAVFGYRVVKLQRVEFAGISFHGLRVGDARELTQAEVDGLRKLVGLPPDPRSVSRGAWKVRREQTDSGRRIRDRARKVTEQSATKPATRAGKPAARTGKPAGPRTGKPGPRTGKPGPRTGKPGPRAGKSRAAAGSGGRKRGGRSGPRRRG